jgi:hypothetical protein
MLNANWWVFVQEGSFGKKSPTLIHPPSSKWGRCGQEKHAYKRQSLGLDEMWGDPGHIKDFKKMN